MVTGVFILDDWLEDIKPSLSVFFYCTKNLQKTPQENKVSLSGDVYMVKSFGWI